MKKILLSLSALLLMSGCVSQEKADAKMARGCKAGINALLGDAQIKEIKSTNFSNENTLDGQFRRIDIEAVEKDGWMELDKNYSCLFAEEWGLFKFSHSAILEKIKLPTRTVGRENGQILGGMQDYLDLTNTVQDAMRQQ